MDEEIKNVQNEDGINEETAEETTANAEVEEEPIGNIKISVDVVSTIAGIATTEIDGVAGMYGTFAGGIAEMFGAKKNPSKGVKVDMNETTATIDLYIVVDYGVRIPARFPRNIPSPHWRRSAPSVQETTSTQASSSGC